VDSTQFDAVAKRIGTTTGRRDFAKSIGALALGGVGILAASRAASAQVSPADHHQRCVQRCLDHASNRKHARDRCRRSCENR
jgi:hypothetical protein